MAATDKTLPEGMQVNDNGSELEIVWKWPRKSLVEIAVYLFFVWNIAKSLHFDSLDWRSALDDMSRSVLEDPFPFNLFDPLFAGVALYMLYSIAAATLNSTRISASRTNVAIRHGPLPWLGNKDVESSSIKQIFADMKMPRRGRRGRDRDLPPTYDLCADGHNGETIKLLARLELTQEQSAYLEQKLERYLGIKDAPQQGVSELDIKAVFLNPGEEVEDPAPDSQRSIDSSVVQVERGAQLTICRNWFIPQKISMMIFAIFWSAITGLLSWMWLTQAGAQPLFPIDPEPAHLVLAVFVTASVVLLYTAAARLVNRTWLVVGRDKLSVRHGPLPWAGNVEFPLSALSELTVAISSFRESNKRPRFDLFALLLDGTVKVLIGGFESSEHAFGVRQEIEQYLTTHSVLGRVHANKEARSSTAS